MARRSWPAISSVTIDQGGPVSSRAALQYWVGWAKVGLQLNGAYVAQGQELLGRSCQRGGYGVRRTRENGVRANKGMKLTKPGELRSFAAYPRCSTDHDGA